MGNYLVCFEAYYAYSTTKFDLEVEWDGYDVKALRQKLKDHIRVKYCNNEETYIRITITFVLKLLPPPESTKASS
jgi:hypothetical protein